MKFLAEITGWGADALFLLEDPDAKFIIIFNDNAPPELADISVLHTQGLYLADPAVGDIFIIAEKVFTITAVGEEVKKTLKELGHCTLCFKGGNKPDRPGCLMLQGDQPLLAADIQKGATIEIH